jgi:hypothetical protein
MGICLLIEHRKCGALGEDIAQRRRQIGSPSPGPDQSQVAPLALVLTAVDALLKLPRPDPAASHPPLLHAPQHKTGAQQKRDDGNHRQRNQHFFGSCRLYWPGISRSYQLRDYCGGDQTVAHFSPWMKSSGANALPQRIVPFKAAAEGRAMFLKAADAAMRASADRRPARRSASPTR